MNKRKKVRKGKENEMRKVRLMTALMALWVALGAGQFPARASDLPPVTIHGFVSLGWLYSDRVNYLADTRRGSFEFNEIGLNFQAQPTDRLRIGVQIFSRDLGDLGNNQIKIDWAVADYRFDDALGIKVGIIKLPLGLYHDQIDLDMSRTNVFLPLSVYNPRYRDVYMNVNGADLYGIIPLGAAGSLEYTALAGNKSAFDPSVFSQDWSWVGLNVDKASIRLMYGGRLIWNTPLEGLRVGGDFYKGENFTVGGPIPADFTAPTLLPGPSVGSLYPAGTRIKIEGKELAIWHIFTQYSAQRLTLTGEMYRLILNDRIKTDKGYDPLIAGAIGWKGFGADHTNYGGWYAQADYQFTKWLTAAITYGEEYNDWDDPTGAKRSDQNWKGFRRDTTVSTRFDITSYWDIKLEAHFMDGTHGLISSMQDNPNDLKRYWNFYAIKSSFNF
jgi:hypothetical protein